MIQPISDIKTFAGDKLYSIVNSIADRDALQVDIDNLYKWSVDWQLPFNMTTRNHLFEYFIGDGVFKNKNRMSI